MQHFYLRPAWASNRHAGTKPPTGKQGGYHRGYILEWFKLVRTEGRNAPCCRTRECLSGVNSGVIKISAKRRQELEN